MTIRRLSQISKIKIEGVNRRSKSQKKTAFNRKPFWCLSITLLVSHFQPGFLTFVPGGKLQHGGL